MQVVNNAPGEPPPVPVQSAPPHANRRESSGPSGAQSVSVRDGGRSYNVVEISFGLHYPFEGRAEIQANFSRHCIAGPHTDRDVQPPYSVNNDF